MSYFFEAEKLLKRNLKKRMGISTSLIVAFLITGALSTTVEGKDLRVRNNIKVSSMQGPSLTLSENDTDVINILNPNSGISHNKYEDFNVGEGNNVIFNNSTEEGTSVTGGKVGANPNLKTNASVILNEVKGNTSSVLNGGLEVFGKKADLVVANENGIQVNGAQFINTSAVTLSTGKVSVNQDKLTLDTSGNSSKISVGEKGMNTNAEYLNFITKTMEINGQVNAKENQNTNIHVIAGENKVNLDSKGSSLEKVGNGKEEGVSISASHLGAMYGNNIHILSTKEGMGVHYAGAIDAREGVVFQADGKIASSHIEGNNIKISSKKEIENTGRIKAKNNVSLQAPVVKNTSHLEGVVRVTDVASEQNLVDRDRGIIYYDYHLKVHNLEAIENGLELKKATIEAGNDLVINTEMENASFENLGGSLSAGGKLHIKGDVTSRELSEVIKVEDILKKIKVDLNWEHRSLVDNAYFNGKTVLKNGSLFEALQQMTNKKQKEFYDALKQIQDPTLSKLLDSYLGSDWKLRDTIPEEKNWNKSSEIHFYAKDNASIKAKNVLLEGKKISFGEEQGRKENVQIKGNAFTKQVAVEGNNSNAVIEAENILVKTDSFKNYNTDLSAKQYVSLESKGDLLISGAKVTAEAVSLEAGNKMSLESQLGYDKEGKQKIGHKTIVEGSKKVGVTAKTFETEAAEVLSEAGTVVIKAGDVNIKDSKVLNAEYRATMEEGKTGILKDHKYTKEAKATVESVASIIKGNKVLMNADQGVNIEASLITGTNANSTVVIQSPKDVKIKNANNINYSNFLSDARGKNTNGVYKLVQIDKKNQEAYEVVGSELKSEGNIKIQAKNLDLVSSSIEAKEKIELAAEENMDILAELQKEKEQLMNVQWGSGAIHSKQKESEKEKVASSTIKAGSELSLHAKKDIQNVSSHLEGSEVSMKAGGKLINSAVADKEKAKETNVAVGIVASGSTGFAGMGASGEIDTAAHTTNSSVAGLNGLIAKDNEFKEVHAKGKVGANLHVTTDVKETETHKNNVIKANGGNVGMEADSTVDLANTDIHAKKNVVVEGAEVLTNSKTDHSKEVKHDANIGVVADVSLSNETATKVNSFVNDAVSLKHLAEEKQPDKLAEKVTEIIKEGKDFVENLPKIASQDILGIKANEKFTVDYDNTTKTVAETGKSSIAAGENVSIHAKDTDVSLKNTHISGEKVEMKAKNTLHLAAGEKKEHEEKNGFHTGLTVKETIGVNAKDGANVKVGIGVEGNYHGSSDVKKESLNSTVQAGVVEKQAEVVKQDDAVSSHYKDKRGLGIDADLKVGLSSNHALAVDGTVNGNAKYSVDAGKEKVDAETGEKKSFSVSAGANASGSIETSGKNPNFSIGTEAFQYTENGKTVVQLKPVADLITKEKVTKAIAKVKEWKEGKKVEEA